MTRSRVDGVGRPGWNEIPRAEWGYPDIGIVFCSTPSGGHDTVMLDYSVCGPQSEPTIAYVDEDRIPRQIASSFRDFLNRLAPDPPPED